MRDRVLSWLENHIPPARVEHILGVETLAQKLAHHYQLDEEKAQIAGLMHDLAKHFKPAKLLKMAKKEGLEMDEILQKNPHLLHADVSAIVARETFGIEDPEILEAIADHTLGRPNMSLLSCVVFVADPLEPSRGKKEILEAMRKSCWESLHKAVWQTSDYTLNHLVGHPLVIHPRLILTRNWALEKSKEI